MWPQTFEEVRFLPENKPTWSKPIAWPAAGWRKVFFRWAWQEQPWPCPAPTDTVNYPELESRGPGPAARVGPWHHSRMTAGLSPFDGKRGKIQRTSRGGCDTDTPRVGAEAAERAQCPPARVLPVPPVGAAGGEGWGGMHGRARGRLCTPGLQVLPLVFCLNAAAGANAARNLQPTAKPCQSPRPRLFKNQRARPSLPPGTVRYGTLQGPEKPCGAASVSPPRRGTRRPPCSLHHTPKGPRPPGPKLCWSGNTTGFSPCLASCSMEPHKPALLPSPEQGPGWD